MRGQKRVWKEMEESSVVWFGWVGRMRFIFVRLFGSTKAGMG
jgi:hypothetical protein